MLHLITRKMQIKTKIRRLFTPLDWQKRKHLAVPSFGQALDQWGLLSTAAEANVVQVLRGNIWQLSVKLNYTYIVTQNYASSYTLQVNSYIYVYIHVYACIYVYIHIHMGIYIHKHTCMCIHIHTCQEKNNRNIVYISKVLETSQCSSRREINCVISIMEFHIAMKRNELERHKSI